MNIFKLRQLPNKDVLFDNLSPMYPVNFERKINELAGEKITSRAPVLGGFFGNFVNTFVVKFDKFPLFRDKVLPLIGSKTEEGNGTDVWDKDEESEANQI